MGITSHEVTSEGQVLEMKENTEYQAELIKVYLQKIGSAKEYSVLKYLFKFPQEEEIADIMIWLEEFGDSYRVAKNSKNDYNMIMKAYGKPLIAEDTKYNLEYSDDKEYKLQPSDGYSMLVNATIKYDENKKTGDKYLKIKTIKGVAMPGDAGAFESGLPG